MRKNCEQVSLSDTYKDVAAHNMSDTIRDSIQFPVYAGNFEPAKRRIVVYQQSLLV